MSVTRTLLFSDIVDSTKVSHALGDERMAKVWAEHDRLARDLLISCRGHEIDKADGMFALFESANDAVSYALAYHRAIGERKLPFAARVGIHQGPVSLRENSGSDKARGAKHLEVDGIAKPIAARVMSVAQGGQTLITRAVRDALSESAMQVEPIGHWRLAGVDEPVELLEVGETDSSMLPPLDSAKAYRVVRSSDLWMPVRQIRHNLPAEPDAFIGRQAELLDLARRVRDGVRQVSILGMGGSGKTRFANRFARTWLGEFPGGAWFCDLSQARSLDGIYLAVAQGLGIPLGRTDPTTQLSHALVGRGHALILLDNFEQVSRYASQTLEPWLTKAPEARFIVTTREVLGLAGEQILALPPLPPTDAEELFLRRAAAVAPPFKVGDQDLATIRRLVTLLDGLPLAIELAAARVRVLAPSALLQRMSERFKLLSSRGGRQDRQATLRATIDWSWGLLSKAEQAMLAQLAVFAGGFSVAAVEAIVDLSSIPDHPWPLDVLQSLVDKSLVRIAGGERFDLLESIREYAAEQLERFGGMTNSFGVTRDQTERRHGTYFAAMGSIGAREKSGAEIENVVAACKRAAARLDEKCAVDALTSAWGALKLRGPFRTGAELGSAVASIPALSAGLAVVANIIKGKALMASGAMREARPCILLAVSTATALGDVAHLCRARESLAELLANEGDVAEAVSTYVKALSDAGQIGDLPLEWNLLSGLATCYEYLGQFDNARIHYERSLAIAHELGDIRLIGGSLGNMGQLNANRGRNAEAQSYYQRAIEIAVQLGDRQWEGNVRCNLGLLHAAEGRNTQARKELEAALVGARELGHVKLECVALCNLGITHEAESDLQAARRCYEDAVRIARSLADKRSEGQFLGYLGHLLGRESQFDSAVELLDRGESLLRAVGDSASLGLLHCQRAQTEYLKGDAGRALIALVEAEALARDIGPDSQSEFGVALAHTRHLLRR